MSDAGFVAPGGDPLAPLSRLSELPPLGPRESRPQLPDLPAEPVGWNRRACRERAAARDATADRLLVATTLRLVLGQARLGSLPANWRERGLRDALTSGRDCRIWVWWKVLAGGPRVWEPGAAEALGLPWGAVLGAWRADTLMWLRETQVADRSSVSRWAGFQVVDATDDEWESLLDRAHSGRWPERGTDVKGPWNVGFSAHMLRQELDDCALRYDAGCAAGGDDVDWVGRHRDRVRRWRFAGDRADELARIERLAREADAGRPPYPLPSYWLLSR